MTCKKIVTLRVQKKDDGKESETKKKIVNRKKRVKTKNREKKIESGKNERKTKKQGSFYAKASDVKNAFYTN